MTSDGKPSCRRTASDETSLQRRRGREEGEQEEEEEGEHEEEEEGEQEEQASATLANLSMS